MMGIGPEQAAEFMERHGCDVVGLNCGTGMDMTRARQAVERYRARHGGLPVMAQPNAGQPRLEDMKVIYKETPEQMVEGLVPLLAAGPRIVGACCGSTPASHSGIQARAGRLPGTKMKMKLCDVNGDETRSTPSCRFTEADKSGIGRPLCRCLLEAHEHDAARTARQSVQAPRAQDRAVGRR